MTQEVAQLEAQKQTRSGDVSTFDAKVKALADAEKALAAKRQEVEAEEEKAQELRLAVAGLQKQQELERTALAQVRGCVSRPNKTNWRGRTPWTHV